MTKKKPVVARYDNNRTRLKTGESQRPNGTYVYRWTTQDGKRNAVYAPTLETLREQEEQIIVDKHDGIRADKKHLTVNDMFDLWCQLKRGIKDSTFKNYIYMYELFVKPAFGQNRITLVKKSDVRKFYNSLADGKILKIATIDNVHNVLHQVFQVAVDDGIIRTNPTDKMLKELKMSHGFEREKKSALTIEQQKLFFDYMLSHPKDRHWYDDFIFVNRFGDVQNQCNLNKTIRRMMRDCNDEILEKYGADSNPVLLPRFSCHILRHTFATRLCESGVNLKVIQDVLGHADVSTTMDIYVDVTNALKKREIAVFDDYMATGTIL